MITFGDNDRCFTKGVHCKIPQWTLKSGENKMKILSTLNLVEAVSHSPIFSEEITFNDKGPLYLICSSILCEEAICEKICDQICDNVCDAICDAIDTYVGFNELNFCESFKGV